MANSSTLYQKISKNLSNSYITSMLRERYKNEEFPDNCMNYKDLINISNIDEYIYYLILENTPNRTGTFLNTYLRELEAYLQKQPLLLLSLPISKIDTNKLQKYIPSINQISNQIKKQNVEASRIFKKLKNTPNLVTGDEFKKLLIFISYSIPYKDENLRNAEEYIAKYLLNYPPNNIRPFYVATFLIKFFGYKKIREEGLNETKIFIADIDSRTRGLSKSERVVVINKKLLQNVSMRNNLLENRNKVTQGGEEILGILHTLYHELRHQRQTYDAQKGLLNDLSFFMGARNIIHSMDNNFDYEQNYKCYETEKDANEKGWEEILKLIKTYMPSRIPERVARNILQHRLTEELEQLTVIRTNQVKHQYVSILLLVQYLDKAFANNPSILTTEYRQFLKFYNYNGTPKTMTELLTMPLVYDFKEFYFGQVLYRSRVLSYNARQKINNFSSKEIQTVINNIKVLMTITESKLNKMCDRVKKGEETSSGVVRNLQIDFDFAIYLSDLTNRIISQHRELLNILAVRNAIESINENIDMINSNALVIKTTGSRNRVSKIGRGK